MQDYQIHSASELKDLAKHVTRLSSHDNSTSSEVLTRLDKLDRLFAAMRTKVDAQAEELGRQRQELDTLVMASADHRQWIDHQRSEIEDVRSRQNDADAVLIVNQLVCPDHTGMCVSRCRG